jgi:hypothetical protein
MMRTRMAPQEHFDFMVDLTPDLLRRDATKSGLRTKRDDFTQYDRGGPLLIWVEGGIVDSVKSFRQIELWSTRILSDGVL